MSSQAVVLLDSAQGYHLYADQVSQPINPAVIPTMGGGRVGNTNPYFPATTNKALIAKRDQNGFGKKLRKL